MTRENIILAAKAKFDAGQDIIAVAMARPAKTVAEAEAKAIKLALARAARKEAEAELELLVHGEEESAWRSVVTEPPPYYEIVWVSDGSGVILGYRDKVLLEGCIGGSKDRWLTVFPHIEPRRLPNVKYWAPCVAPKI